ERGNPDEKNNKDHVALHLDLLWGVGVGSEVTPVPMRDEGGKELALADGPLGRPAQDRVCMRRVRPAEQVPAVPQRAQDIRGTEPCDGREKSVEEPAREPPTALDVREPHASCSALCAAASRSAAAPNAAETMTSKS